MQVEDEDLGLSHLTVETDADTPLDADAISETDPEGDQLPTVVSNGVGTGTETACSEKVTHVQYVPR